MGTTSALVMLATSSVGPSSGAITGSPDAIASSSTLPKVSVVEANTNPSADAKNSLSALPSSRPANTTPGGAAAR